MGYHYLVTRRQQKWGDLAFQIGKVNLLPPLIAYELLEEQNINISKTGHHLQLLSVGSSPFAVT